MLGVRPPGDLVLQQLERRAGGGVASARDGQRNVRGVDDRAGRRAGGGRDGGARQREAALDGQAEAVVPEAQGGGEGADGEAGVGVGGDGGHCFFVCGCLVLWARREMRRGRC